MRWLRGVAGPEAGVSLTMVAVAMPLVLGVLGLVVDAGLYGLSTVQLTSAADSAGMAAVSAVDLRHYRATGEVRLDPEQARAKAELFASLNYQAAGLETQVDILPPGNRLRVTLTATYTTVFMKLFDLRQLPLEAETEASAS